jgi:hypothetical protein
VLGNALELQSDRELQSLLPGCSRSTAYHVSRSVGPLRSRLPRLITTLSRSLTIARVRPDSTRAVDFHQQGRRMRVRR